MLQTSWTPGSKKQAGNLTVYDAGDFDPDFIKSTNYFYDPRPGDFKREGAVWIAANNLGPGDLDAIPGFERSRDIGPTGSDR